MNKIPAIAVGGPPHSGKSVLIYSLTQALRSQGVAHYVVRACPDGEGDWSNEATPETVEVVRIKGEFTPEFVEDVRRAIRGRHLPLLVDVGGRPTREQEVILAECTQIVLLAPDEAGLDAWRTLARRNGLPVLAELHSSLHEPDAIFQEVNPFRGRIHGLERHEQVHGPALQRLAWLVRDLFVEGHQRLPRLHLENAPTELTVELGRLLEAIAGRGKDAPAQDGTGTGSDSQDRGGRWVPRDLPAALAYVPGGEALAIYGRGPNWLYAALAVHAHPAPFYQFDPRLGWVQPAPLRLAPNADTMPPVSHIHWSRTERNGLQYLDGSIGDSYLQYAEAQHLPVPRPDAGKGLVLSGKLPHWFVTGWALACWSQMTDLPFLATYQPQVGNIVVATRDESVALGALVE